jgi:hypothetical protein
MKNAGLAFVLLVLSVMRADGVVIHSPDTAQTYALHSVQWKQLRWLPRARAFVASITFSNLNYESRAEPRRDERFDFAFPGVRLDAKDQVFYVLDQNHSRIPVARIAKEFVGKQIELLPGSSIEILSHDGKIHVALCTSCGRCRASGVIWIEHDTTSWP